MVRGARRRGTWWARLAAVVALVGVVPARAGALGPLSLTIEGWGGAQQPNRIQVSGGGSFTGNDTLDGTFDSVGFAVTAKTWILEVGISYDAMVAAPTTRTAVLAPAAGLGFDLGPVRLELLGEYGGRRYTNIGGTGQAVTVPMAGVRPGVSLRFPIIGSTRIVVGAWGFARWNLETYDVGSVSQSVGGGVTLFHIGQETTFGVVGRLGIEL